MLRRHAHAAIVFALGFVLRTQSASADCSTPVTSGCISSDTFWPHAGPAGEFLSVGGTETVDASRIAFGLVATYLSRPIVLEVPSPAPNTPRNAVDNEINATFLFAYGVTKKLELDLALPVTIFQDGDGTAPIVNGAQVPTTATRDLRFGATYTLLAHPKKHPWRHDASGFGLAARFEISAPTGDQGDFNQGTFASEPSAVYIPSLALDYRSHRFFFGAELAARIRPTTDFDGARIGTQGVIAGGVGVDVLDKHDLLSVTGELRFLPVFTEQATITQTVSGLQSTSNGSFITPAEWMVTARSAPLEGGDLTFQLGVGGWFPTASFSPITVPRFRVALGLTFAPRGRDTDGDGIPDAIDRCPLEPGPKSSEEGTGCPEKPQP